MYKKFIVTDVDDENERVMWPQTRELFLTMKQCFFALVVVHIVTYYAHVYRQAMWKYVDEKAPEDDKKKTEEKEGKNADDSKAKSGKSGKKKRK